MKYMKYIFAAIIAMGFWACSDKDDDNSTPAANGIQVDTILVNVDVVLPASIQEQWKNTFDWALENIRKAQQVDDTHVMLNLRFHDEDKENLDNLAYKLTHPDPIPGDTCHAIIGPYYNEHATTFLSYAAQERLPVLMPTCASDELQRMNARNTYAWFFTESDITQCEIMFSAIKTMKGEDVVLIYSDDSYGKSFYNWFNFLATENGLNILGTGAQAYKTGDNLYEFLEEAAIEADGRNITICLALSNPSDILQVNKQVLDFISDPPEDVEPLFTMFCTDTSLCEEVVYNNRMQFFIGLCPVASVNSGFNQVYRKKFGRLPYNGEAQLYDALSLIALGAAHQKTSPNQCLVNGKQASYSSKPYGPGLTDYIRSVVTDLTGKTGQWNDAGLTTAFHAILTGGTASLYGATGNLVFDEDSNTKILYTNYMVWTVDKFYTGDDINEKVMPICYLSTGGSSTSASIKSIWEREKQFEQQFDDTEVDHQLPAVTDHWAVIISPSTTWANYRHQADAFAMYQTLRQHGYDDDHIVLIVEDNLANDTKNDKFPGQIFVERSDDENVHDDLVNLDVRNGAKVDYHFTEITPEDVADIMLGHQSSRLPHVIHPTSTSNVFFFWSGHGGSKEGPLWGNEDARSYFGKERIKDIVTQMNEADMYRRLMFSIETCFSGQWGQALTEQPDVIVLTAANPYETSKADVHNSDIGVFLSNAFARTFRKYVNQDNRITLRDLYIELAKTTNGSHVSIYNEKNYGSVYSSTMEDFFPR